MAGLLAAVCPGLGHLYVGRPGLAGVFAVSTSLTFQVVVAAGALWPSALFPLLILGVATSAFIWFSQVISAVALARSRNNRPKSAWYNGVAGCLGFFIASGVAMNVLLQPLRHWVLEPFRVSSQSMLPTLLDGDLIYVLKAGPGARWGRGDVVAFRWPDSAPAEMPKSAPVLGRVVAVGGETVRFEERLVFVNDVQVATKACEPPAYPYIDTSQAPVPRTADCVETPAPSSGTYRVLFHPDFDGARWTPDTTTLGPDEVFILGDNRDNVLDSRRGGPIHRDAVLGRAAMIYFSFSSLDGVRWSRLGRHVSPAD